MEKNHYEEYDKKHSTKTLLNEDLLALLQNPVKEIKKLADFLRVDCSATHIEEVAKATSFKNMQENKFDITQVFDGKGFIYRKGKRYIIYSLK